MFTLLLFLIKLAVALFIVRFHVNAYRLGRNPLVEKLNRFTNPVVLPFNRLIRHPRREFGALACGLLIAILAATALYPYSFLIGLITGTLVVFLGTWLDVVMYSLLIVIIASWLQADPRQPLLQVALSCNEWLMAPLRRIIPPFGMIDLSPIAAFIGIQLVKWLLLNLNYQLIAGILRAAA